MEGKEETQKKRKTNLTEKRKNIADRTTNSLRGINLKGKEGGVRAELGRPAPLLCRKSIASLVPVSVSRAQQRETPCLARRESGKGVDNINGNTRLHINAQRERERAKEREAHGDFVRQSSRLLFYPFLSHTEPALYSL
mmetsp:Transcript_39225/g.77167  ORF Transcript_39225/g.77167 Transcript_39225/m.77167 type:complete len:139 (-) Transcript_39225:879-1295(-)